MKNITHLQSICTTNAVFCLAFSPDGHTLAAGTGSYYGAGNLLLYPFNTSLDPQAVSPFISEPHSIPLTQQGIHPNNPQMRKRQQSLSATALHFTPDAKHLWVATSGVSRNKGPLLHFELSEDNLALPIRVNLINMHHHYPDGFVHYDNQLFICGHNLTGAADEYIYQIDIDSNRTSPSSSNRLLLMNRQFITPSKKQRGFGLDFTSDLSFCPNQPLTEHIVRVEGLGSLTVISHKLMHSVPVEHPILCLAQDANNPRFITGNAAGQLHHWWFNGQWQHQSIEADRLCAIAAELTLEDPSLGCGSVIAIQMLPEHQGWLSLHANGVVIYWHDYQVLCYQRVSHTGSPRCLSLHPNKPLLAIGLKPDSQGLGQGIILLDISQWLMDTQVTRQNAVDARNAPFDKLYFTPEPGLPPQAIRGQLSSLTNLALAVRDERCDKAELKALLNDLQNDAYFVNLARESQNNKVQAFESQLKGALSDSCHWWEESWRYTECWPIIKAVLNNTTLPSPAQPAKAQARSHAANDFSQQNITDNNLLRYLSRVWAFIKKHK
ncbi:hypothetical protein Sden_1580 [Shewanella denitrificans OS217]|jgi:WD40 repeat protein|uniref:Uncharacterized protein n=1 Tax=Shewanella denitrificans (strain OS217 / ATCC BAA-1090 / DSM 15013) TaxID=318161 RepID=Q12NW2_SHEDO|nr:hypothetical protein Sden_1580 [Shewanella denitrificans OS217]